uniref:Uncharacterized protein n=1 Tax=Verrucosispora sp. MS100047 TaxID=1410949 RepID=A0A097CSF1_9ACTN|nr:hypothetical protein VASRM7_346 [Verrucosispora sp. MS100047]
MSASSWGPAGTPERGYQAHLRKATPGRFASTGRTCEIAIG